MHFPHYTTGAFVPENQIFLMKDIRVATIPSYQAQSISFEPVLVSASTELPVVPRVIEVHLPSSI